LLGLSDVAADCVVGAANPALDLELNVYFEACFWASNDCVVSQLVFHLAEEDAARVHVRLGDEAIGC
jgi:hypothetical protein